MDNEKCVTVYYHGDGYDAAIDRELKRRGLEPGEVAAIAIPETRKWMGIGQADTQ
jgi:hypothetical protein